MQLITALGEGLRAGEWACTAVVAELQSSQWESEVGLVQKEALMQSERAWVNQPGEGSREKSSSA